MSDQRLTDERASTTHRRTFLSQIALGAAAFTTPGLFAEHLLRTPSQGEGPFYPDKLPLDTDNDLIVLNDTLTPAVGQITHLGGRVLDLKGQPLRGAVVEIWQCDGNGVYLHSGTSNKEKRDSNFQGFGRFLTGSKGEYYFRTIKPVPYPGRTPHIHVIVKKGENRLLTTQLYMKSEMERNKKDGLYRRVTDPKALDLITIDFKRIKESKTGEFSAHADIVVGLTPEDPKARQIRPRREA